MQRPSFAQAAMAVAAKDLRIELRTREIVTTAGFFAALVAVMSSLAFLSSMTTVLEPGPVSSTGVPVPLGQQARIAVQIAPGAIWMSTAFASILALGRTWQRERDEGALTGLLVAPIPRAAIFVGKAIGVLAFVLAVECVCVPLVALFFHVELGRVLAPLVVVLFLVTIGIAATGTLFGAMTVRTRARDLVLATVLFPLLSPTLLSGVVATRELFGSAANPNLPALGFGASMSLLSDFLLLLGTFDLLAVMGGIALFGELIDE